MASGTRLREQGGRTSGFRLEMAIWLVCAGHTNPRCPCECIPYTAMLPGGTSQELIQLNIESLWSGGPFQDPVRGQPFILEVMSPSCLAIAVVQRR